MMFRLLLILYLGHCLPAVLGADSSIDSHVRDTVMLPCDGPTATDTTKVDVLWMFGGKPAGWFKDGSWCETGHYVNRTQLGSIRQNNFSLVINPVKEEDEGEYVCRINGENNRRIRLIVDGNGKRRDAETPPTDPVCRPYREREDPPGSVNKDKQISGENPSGSVNKDKQISGENPSGASSGGNSVVIGVSLGIVKILMFAV